VPTDDGNCIQAKSSEFVKVFRKTKAEIRAPQSPIDHAIDPKPEIMILYGRIYNLSQFELRTLKAYIEKNLANDFIQQSSSSAAALILFAMMKDGGL
jgi:hypothetical protein